MHGGRLRPCRNLAVSRDRDRHVLTAIMYHFISMRHTATTKPCCPDLLTPGMYRISMFGSASTTERKVKWIYRGIWMALCLNRCGIRRSSGALRSIPSYIRLCGQTARISLRSFCDRSWMSHFCARLIRDVRSSCAMGRSGFGQHCDAILLPLPSRTTTSLGSNSRSLTCSRTRSRNRKPAPSDI